MLEREDVYDEEYRRWLDDMAQALMPPAAEVMEILAEAPDILSRGPAPDKRSA